MIDPVHHTLPHHFLGAAGREFLGVLKDETDLASQMITVLRKQGRESERNRCVPVVSAGVHRTIDFRPIRDVVLLVDRKGIDVGPHRDHRPRTTRYETCHDAGLGGARYLKIADLLQHLSYKPGCFVLLEGHFRPAVQRAAPLDKPGCELMHFIEQRPGVGRRKRSDSCHE